MKPNELIINTLDLQDASFYAIRRIETIVELMKAAGRLPEAPPLDVWVIEEVATLIDEELEKLKKIIKSLQELVDSVSGKRTDAKCK